MTISHPTGSIWTLRRVEQDPLAFLGMLAGSRADVVPCALGRQRAFLLNHPASVEDVLIRHPGKFIKGPGYARAGRLLGNGLLTASDAQHAARRRLLQPAFHRQRVTGYARAMVARAARLRDQWAPGAPVDVAGEMQGLTLAIAGETLFGADLRSRAAEVRDAVAMAIPAMDGLVSVVAPPYRVRCAKRRLEALVDELIRSRLEADEERDDLLALLLAAGAPRQQVRDEAITVLLAGHDTISHALAWTWLLLAQHPDVERRLHGELAEVTGGRQVSADDWPRLVYAKSVLAEALRMFPPAWVIVRRAVEPHQCGDTLIPAGSLVIASPYVAHRDARFFADPLAFDPGRWLSPEASSRPKLAYFPFGAGSRSCIGESFAWMEGTLVLATLAQAWRLVPSGAPPVPSPRMTLRPQGKVMMVPQRNRERLSSPRAPAV